MISSASDLGRVLGASAIFYYHVGLYTGYPLSQWGEYAVAFFIILSGLGYTYFSSLQPTDWPSYRRYMGVRLKAIFPTFLSINLVIFVGSFLHPSALGRPFTFIEWGLSSAGLSQYFGYRFLSRVMWFIPFIIQTYLVFPLIDRILKRVPASLVVVLAFTASTGLVGFVFSYWPSDAIEICQHWSVLFRLPEVALGVILGRCIFCRRDVKGGLAAVVTFVLLSLALAGQVGSRSPDQAHILSLPWKGLVVTLIVAAAAIAAVAGFGNARGTGFLRLLGNASFPFFLAHAVAIAAVYARVGTDPVAWAVYFLLCWGGAIGVAVVLRQVERAIRARRTMQN